MSSKAAIIVPAIKRHTSTIIVAHGLGDSGAGWRFLPDFFNYERDFAETKFIFPNAPTMPITANGNAQMPGWYDIKNFDDLASRVEDDEGILRSQKVFHELIAQEIKAGIPSERIILGGFSQGGAMSLFAGITAPVKLGGVFGLSCYLLLQGKFQSLVPKDNFNKATPVFMGHGDSDPLVKYKWGQASAAALKEWGYDVDFKTYKGLTHSAAEEELRDLKQFILAKIPPLGSSSN